MARPLLSVGSADRARNQRHRADLAYAVTITSRRRLYQFAAGRRGMSTCATSSLSPRCSGRLRGLSSRASWPGTGGFSNIGPSIDSFGGE